MACTETKKLTLVFLSYPFTQVEGMSQVVELISIGEKEGKVVCQAGFEALMKRNDEKKQYWLNIKIAGKLLCRTCKEEKELSLFSKRKNSYEMWVTECRICENKRKNKKTIERKIKGGVEREIKEIYRSMKNNCEKRKIKILISEEYMLELYKKQDGICAYTGRKMTVETNTMNKMSLDRIDSSKDYEEGNVIWCIWAANNMKQDLSLPNCIQLMTEMLDKMKKICDLNDIKY